MRKFVNLSNHKQEMWSDKQLEAAQKWGEIETIPFPAVPADASSEYITNLADELVEKVVKLEPAVVMCQGEFTLTYELVKRFKERSIPVMAACSERRVVEKVVDGVSTKEAVFEFVQFREY